ncbi:MAG: type II toxin-antitoxin system YafQ family toxin [bacterium]|nr:type II toxin-antitoxin system YafQ family toxin [bacterium]
MNYRFTVDFTKNFKKEYKRVMKQGKDISKLNIVISKIASGELLEEKYKDHKLYDNKKFKNCRECHIEPDWLLIYKIDDMQLILLLVETGSHSELF